MRIKMHVVDVHQNRAPNGVVYQEHVKLQATMDDSPENTHWSLGTPNGQLEILASAPPLVGQLAAHLSLQVTAPAAIGTIAAGHEFIVDIQPVVTTP